MTIPITVNVAMFLFLPVFLCIELHLKHGCNKEEDERGGARTEQ